MFLVDPTSLARRSPLMHRHKNNRAIFTTIGNNSVVESYESRDGNIIEQANARELAICDLSTLPRIGFKGRGASAWLGNQDFNLPSHPNSAVVQSSGSIIAKLSDQEALILTDIFSLSDDVNKLVIKSMTDHRELTQQIYILPRGDSHCWFAVTGMKASEMFSKICAVDLRSHKFSLGSVAQTSLAKVNSVIIRQDLGNTPCFYVLSDITSAEFLWDCLLDAMHEYQGVNIGITALQSLTDESSGS